MHDGWSECRRVIAQHSKSFDLASRLLRQERRNEVAALYAWCRLCDDAIDLAPASEHATAIVRLRDQLHSVYAGTPQADPILDCFQQVVRKRGVPIEYPLELLEGMRMDVDEVRYETVNELLVYCWRVAGTVGLMMCHVLGVSDRRAAPHAAHLGIGMQLTNIARDIAEDWERGRLYLPTELLGPSLRHALLQAPARTRPLAATEPDRRQLALATRRLLEIADAYYASADLGLRYLEPRSGLAIRAARLVYSEIGRILARREYDATRGRVFVPTARKLTLVLAAIRRFPSDRRAWGAPDLRAPDGVLACTDALRLS